MIRIAKFISFIANPLIILIPVPFLLIYKTTHNFSYAFNWTLYSLGFMLAFVSFILLAVRNKLFTDIDVSRRKQRPLLFLAAVILSTLYLAGLFALHGPFILFLTVFGIVIGIFLASLLNIKIKISIHVATVTAFLFALCIAYGRYFYVSLLLIPLIGWARVRMKRHTIAEAVIGGIIGSLLSLLMYFITKLFINT